MRLPALLITLAAIGLSGCVSTTSGTSPSGETAPSAAQKPRPIKQPTSSDLSRFKTVVARVEPVAERVCKAQRPNTNCDFKIVVDERKNLPPNAYQTLDRSGRPILAFTQSMIAGVRNADELAFVLGHEAAHHIEGHIPRQQQNAIAGAILLGGLATLAGAGGGAVDAAANLGGSVGARSYSKDFELEADALGTVITKRAGYNPVLGAQFFTQIPDPGNVFLGSHPPNAQRIETVRRVNAGL